MRRRLLFKILVRVAALEKSNEEPRGSKDAVYSNRGIYDPTLPFLVDDTQEENGK